MPASPYLLDAGRHHLIQFSGGRSSGFMLFNILQAHEGQLPANARVTFCNTGKERPETLDFVHDVGERWRVPITWLEYFLREGSAGTRKDPKHHYRVVNWESASRDGEPFESVIRSRKILPNVSMRFCTTELKVRTVARWSRRELGWRKPVTVLGMRYDEPKRWGKAIFEECQSIYPMAVAKHTIADVTKFWAQHPFDLGIESIYGNCDLCFLKGANKLRHIIKQTPEAADWWIRQEAEVTKLPGRRLRKSEMALFSKRQSYDELKNPRQGQLFDDEGATSCFCGDWE